MLHFKITSQIGDQTITNKLVSYLESADEKLTNYIKSTIAAYFSAWINVYNTEYNENKHTHTRDFFKTELKLALISLYNTTLIIIDPEISYEISDDKNKMLVIPIAQIIDEKAIYLEPINSKTFLVYYCDSCNKEISKELYKSSYKCEKCNYDLCNACNHIRFDHEHTMFEELGHYRIVETDDQDITDYITFTFETIINEDSQEYIIEI